MRWMICLAAMAAPSFAQESPMRAGDALIARAVLDARLRGQEVVFPDGGLAHYYNDGRYTYAYDMGGGGYAYGYYEVTEDSVVCVRFVTGFSRCDVLVENGGQLVLVTSDLQRFEVQGVRDAGPDPALIE